LKRSPRLGLDPVLFVDDNPGKVGGSVFEMGYERKLSAPVMAGPITGEVLAKYRIDVLIVTAPLDQSCFQRTAETAIGNGARVFYVPSHGLSSDTLLNYHDIDGVLLASFTKPPSRIEGDVTKRLVDIVGSMLFITLGLPIFLLVAIIIKLD